MLSAAPALAIPLVGPLGSGTSGIGSFTGDFDYDPTTGVVTVSLTNTSPAANGGYITALAFNFPFSVDPLVDVTGVSLTSDDPGDDFDEFGGPTFNNTVNAAPFGDFDIAAVLAGGNWEGGGGAPSQGIGVGSTVIFSFALTGNGLGGLTAQDFLSTLSVNPAGGFDAEAFVVRFRGFEDGGSDKVPGDPGEPIPEPGTALLLSLGLASLSARRLRSRRK